jgi:uncharacterized protein (TIGR02246 family)
VSVEERLQRLEDLAAITQLVAAYGHAVDRGDAAATAALFTADGTYDVGPAPLVGADAIAAMVSGRHHQGLIEAGCAHFMGVPAIVLDGDTAVVTNHSVVFRRDEQGFEVWRVAANRWDLTREDGTWKVSARANRLLDGSSVGRELL